MTARITSKEIKPRAAMRPYPAGDSVTEHNFTYSGDTSTTIFELPLGWRPKMVFVDRLFQREGAGEDYTVEFDGFAYSVTFAVAPGLVNIDIPAERRL